MPTGPIIKEGFPLIGAMLIIAVVLGFLGHYVIAIISFILALFFVNFFRNPKRVIPQDPDLILSPADGKIMDISDVYEDIYLHKECKKVTIFLSVFDVHANRSPMEGEIKFQQYTCGRFIPAYKDSVGSENERHTIGIENGNMRIIVTQIAGILARRIVSWVTLGNMLEKGERYGLIKFGSCTELVMPKNVEICVKKGDKVIGGETIIGRIKE